MIRSHWSRLLVIMACFAAVPSPAHADYSFTPQAKDSDAAIDKLRDKIFGAHAKESRCQAVSTGPQPKLENIDPALNHLIQDILGLLRDGKETEFRPLFHPRVWRKNLGEKIKVALDHKYKRPWDLSVYRIWALNTPQSERDVLPCPGDGVSVVSRYGYHLQFGALIQLMGQDELAHLYIAIAPTEGHWNIVGWQIIQWSHLGKDFEAWMREGMALKEGGRKHEASMYLDLAQKLLDGGDFLAFDLKNKLIAERDALDNQKTWPDQLNKLFQTTAFMHAGTFLADDGVGLLVRETTTLDLSTQELQKRCLSRGKTLLREKWLTKNTGGLRCSFLLKGEDPTIEGQLGGFFFSVQDLATKNL